MHKKKLSFLIFLGLLPLILKSAVGLNSYNVIGHKLCGSFELQIEKKRNAQHPALAHEVRIKLVPGEGFLGFRSDAIEGFAGVLIG